MFLLSLRFLGLSAFRYAILGVLKILKNKDLLLPSCLPWGFQTSPNTTVASVETTTITK